MNVVELHPKSPADNPDVVLEQAKGVYSDVLIIGYTKEDMLEIRSSNLTYENILWLISTLQHRMLSGEFSEI